MSRYKEHQIGLRWRTEKEARHLCGCCLAQGSGQSFRAAAAHRWWPGRGSSSAAISAARTKTACRALRHAAPRSVQLHRAALRSSAFAWLRERGLSRVRDTRAMAAALGKQVNFAYSECGEDKNALVKLRVCPECAAMLNHGRKTQLKSVARARKEARELAESRSRRRRGAARSSAPGCLPPTGCCPWPSAACLPGGGLKGWTRVTLESANDGKRLAVRRSKLGARARVRARARAPPATETPLMVQRWARPALRLSWRRAPSGGGNARPRLSPRLRNRWTSSSQTSFSRTRRVSA